MSVSGALSVKFTTLKVKCPMEKKIRVALVEDHLEIREGLSYIINNTQASFVRHLKMRR